MTHSSVEKLWELPQRAAQSLLEQRRCGREKMKGRREEWGGERTDRKSVV